MFLSHYIDHTIKKIKSQAANMLTILNLGLGVASLTAILQKELQLGLLLIFLAAFTDRFDGLVARKLNIESEFGKQLDSLCDLISFGVAPAFLMYESILHQLGAPSLFYIIIYIACGAIRLAKFNITENNGYFTGLPITVAGVILTLFTLGANVFPTHVFIYVTIGMALLMVGPFRVKKM
ncbi:CDP-diacylglycerol--serine O-phosphatidyltransferase [Calidifontibacillus erzurumensis]|uniref:CDP-diacylglycerol--serine O-phosphatidyltransferase n=1 Tax=Calidifontibacillus erzurumensis TaxID=2741433 RepID=A0A8J8GEB7_9BACI|nr:CDP-diacylglycerol--serine O-phosphatidyltransferase [Calidifontibacillus erzurumensis]NSL50248.1 CDP-diacylglycerol--serine O-phosphatidyltransferase [Calidifontibacillus erzurumensis]